MFIYDEIQWNAGTDGRGVDPRYGKSNNGAMVSYKLEPRGRQIVSFVCFAVILLWRDHGYLQSLHV